jgi:hypothetical protein
MLKRILLCLPIIFLAGFSAPTTLDPMIISDLAIAGQAPFLGTLATGAPRNITINPAQKTLVLLVAGQSNWTNINPTLYTPTNSAVISQLNIYDGAFYPITTGVLGSSYYQGTFGPGNASVRVADLLVTNGRFDNVILVNFAIGSTSIAQWASQQFTNRVNVAMLRLAARGIAPSTTGVTFGLLMGQGETDNSLGTSQSAYASSFSTFATAVFATGFSGRVFLCEETWIYGTVSAGVQAAQIAAVNNTTIFSGGNLDSLNATNRQADNTHFNDTGAAAAATIVYNAMHASGSPY